ncbi:nuclear transport factor 2 family protein [Leptospira yasudae]|uniref:Nuclear transport factor 2 family protein n=1 Tax=Leptospira yasudae TaxID=2202201 RepID=A0A6N4QSJ9_9LEPT|nr:nuclear transport factor 2 family protein [Leptospira yasudae]TGL76323.1 nuclear transport factor 2 family protein [Leptospira yasudae]TGL82423.1 nuclear transport factor 2 family protein [Leptospira yasudae]TGL84355.1 nuclear transport factor 2 family protein [Leptospira yasudae]
MNRYKQTITTYLDLLSNFVVEPKDFESVLHPEILQTEYPNALTKKVTISNWDDLFRRMPAGKNLLKRQIFRMQTYLESGDTAVVEADWEATIRADLGPFKADQNLKAYFCMIFEFKENKIHRQKNYDCFEPFA